MCVCVCVCARGALARLCAHVCMHAYVDVCVYVDVCACACVVLETFVLLTEAACPKKECDNL